MAARVIRISEPTIGTAEINAVASRLAGHELTQSGGHTVAAFEFALARFLGVDPERVVACTSGTTALHLALVKAGIGPGDLVAVPALTYVASVAAIRYVGASPVFVDVDPRTWTIDPAALRRCASTAHISAVIPVDLYGFRALDGHGDLDGFGPIKVIRDCCQSLGVPLDLNHPAVFSFYANKLITTGGEGGAVVATSRASAERVRQLRGQGQSVNRRYWHEVIGFNYRMTAMQAAFGIAQLEQVRSFIERRAAIADVYRAELAAFDAQSWVSGLAPVDWLYSLLVSRDHDRDAVGRFMAQQGVETRPVFPSIAKMPPYVAFTWCNGYDANLSVTDDIAARGLSLPVHPSMSLDDASYVCRALKSAINHASTKKGA